MRISIFFIFLTLLSTFSSGKPCDDYNVEIYYQSKRHLIHPDGPKGKLRFHSNQTGGSTKSAWYVDQLGQKWLVKPDSQHAELQTSAEVISSRIYRFLGYEAPASLIIDTNGRAVAVQEVQNIKRMETLQTGEESDSFFEMRFVAAFLKDWDRLRLGPNNYRLKDGRFGSLDFGGTLGSRAQGEHKPGTVFSRAVGGIAPESFSDMISSYRVSWLPEGHPWRARLNRKQLESLRSKFRYLTDKVLEEIVSEAKYSSSSDAKFMFETLKVRRLEMLNGIESLLAKPNSSDHSKTTSLNIKKIVSFYDSAGYRSHQILNVKFTESYQDLDVRISGESVIWKGASLKRYLGTGSNGIVYLGDDGYVYKIALAAKKAPALVVEAQVNKFLKDEYDHYKIQVDSIYDMGNNGVFLKKKYYDPKQLGSNMRSYSDIQIAKLRELFDGAVKLAKETGIGLDIKAANLWWTGSEWLLLDCGPRLGYRPYGYTLDIGGFERYLRYWAAGQGAPLPKSGPSLEVSDFLGQD